MAYGTPETPDDVEAYLAHIRGGRQSSPEAVANLKRRYELVGGRTPLLEITRATGRALERELEAAEPGRYRVYVGMKHWHPFIGDVVRRMSTDGIGRAIAVTLAPHYSRMSVGAYRQAVESTVTTLDAPMHVTFVDSWHRQPAFIEMAANLVRDAIATFPAAAQHRVVTVFTAHSLPARIREWGDPYEAQLKESSQAVAARAGIKDWRMSWQSAGHTGEPWLGPDICEYLETLHAEGVRDVLQVPIGFVSDHLEILYDIDIEARRVAERLGMTLRRTSMPNDNPALIRTLAAVVAGAEGTAGARVERDAAIAGVAM
jgi:protoporphyrin/coproporphyrin ferrochelatase